MITQELILNSFIILLALAFIIKFSLLALNISYIKKNKDKVPSEFVEKITIHEHRKAQDYTVTVQKLGGIKLVISFLLLCFWTLFGGINILNNLSLNLPESIIWQGVSFFILYALIGIIINIPFELYRHFVIEERFGFNKMTFKIYLTDFLKQLVLSALIGIPLLYIILNFIQFFPQYWWLYSWAFFIFFQFVMLWAYPKFIAPWFNKFSKLENEELTQEIDDLCERCEVNFKDYYVMNASLRSAHGNAYFTGFGRNKRIVFFDTLIESLASQEVISVLAHELGHFKKKHILKSLVIAIFSLFIGFFILGVLFKTPAFYLAFGVENPTPHSALLLFSLITPIYTFWLTPIGSWFSRKNEYEADEFAATHASASSLISALIKMYRDNSSTLTPHPWYSKFYFSHPPALERMKFLEKFNS
ncbi:MAG: peptidase M48 [Halobacteriovoraceae bacterium]|nr:peptidase M48 [Halobacteriovoraceae bacterium]|tara:strand:- start:10424 stop:11677 length:1254 start_codon:yes stop_codon:yes gene_type:complete